MNSLSSVAMTLASFSILLIVLNTGFSLQSVLGESIEDSVDRIIESVMDDDNDERDNDDYLSEDFSGGLFDDFNDDSNTVFLDYDEDNNNLSIGGGNQGNNPIYMITVPDPKSCENNLPNFANCSRSDRLCDIDDKDSNLYKIQRQIEDCLSRD